jgi:hypothetical protein
MSMIQHDYVVLLTIYIFNIWKTFLLDYIISQMTHIVVRRKY